MEESVTGRILGFLEEIGIPVIACRLESTFLPGLDVRDGVLLMDPDRLAWPGDLLHEAGHIACTDPALRPSLCRVPNDPGEEMAAIAWSYAACVALDLDPRILFHEGGYLGDGRWLIANFTSGRDVGVPMLEWFGMTAGRALTAPAGARPYPHMDRWLR